MNRFYTCLRHACVSPHSISRSDNLGVRASGEGPPTVSMYHKHSLELKGSELCFEEVRAARYFRKIRRDQEHREFGNVM